ncbi:LysM peptidoglycan-binding domain-containing protein [Paenibacillus solisilvae]|uniref:LysM peptidoglycan-binding domain-containing protein n=1 Tax=Paenibacillus solisilvae TaxID=2486751 RepID=A0ABW0VSQ8_9BACL
MNTNSTGSDYRPRAARTRKNKTTIMISVAAVAFLIICGTLYSIYTAQTSSGPKQTTAGNVPAENVSTGNEPAETNTSTNDDQASSEQTGSPDAPDVTPAPGDLASNNAEPETSAEAGQGGTVDPDGTKAETADPGGSPVKTSAPVQENNGGTASEPSGQAAKLPTTYVVQKGDTLSTISLKFYQSKLHVALLAEQNHIVFINDMKVGDTIKIPALSSDAGSSGKQQDMDYTKLNLPVTYLVRADDTLYSIAMQFYRSKDYVDLIAEHNKLKKTDELKAGSSLIIPAIPVKHPAGGDNSTNPTAKEHTVQPGETLSSISRKYFGSSKYAMTIAKYNHLADNDDVKVGDVLKIPPVSKP